MTRSPHADPRRRPRAAVGVALHALAGLLVGGCALESFESAAETDTILTVRRAEFDFASQMSFAIDPEVEDLSDLVDDPREVGDEWDAPILASVRANLDALGWDEVDFPPTPGEVPDADVVVVAGKVATDNWGYYGGCYPWFGYAFWWCYPAYAVVNYPVGSVVLTMLDPDDVDDSGDVPIVPVVWAAGLSGLIATGSSNTASRLDRAIDQAFDQSPYLDLGRPE